MKRVLLIFLLIILILTAAGMYIYYQHREPSDYLTLYGNVDVRQVDIGFRVSGRIESMNFQEGDLVPAGTLMAQLDKQPYADKAEQAKASVASIKRSFENAEQLLKRRKDLLSDGSVSQEDYENSLSQRDVLVENLKEQEAALGVATTNLQDTEVYSPNEGIILTRIREPGAVVKEADPIYTLSLKSPVWVRAFITEPFLGVVVPGNKAEIYTSTEDGKVYHGHIGFVSPVAEFTPKTVETTQLRTDLVYRIRVIVDNPDNGLRQGMPVTVKIPLKEGKENP